MVGRKNKIIQGFADQLDMYIFFQATKAIYELGSNSHIPLQSQDRTLLKDNTVIQQRWREHFKLLLNQETVVTEDTILSIPQYPDSWEIIARYPANPGRVQHALVQMKNHKACCPDGIPAESLVAKI